MCTLFGSSFAQHSTSLYAVLSDSLKRFQIEQDLVYHNTSGDTLRQIYLNDWINAFENKSTPLARRFSEDFIRRFHFAREEERGWTTIHSLKNGMNDNLDWQRPDAAPDIIAIKLESPLLPGEKREFHVNYTVKIPSDDFTRFGYAENGNYHLRYWFLTPAVYQNGWQVYSNKNLNDLFSPVLDIKITLRIPRHLSAISDLEVVNTDISRNMKTVVLTGENQLDYKLYLVQYFIFEEFMTEQFAIVSNLENEGLSPVLRASLMSRITGFLGEKLGEYPHPKMLVSREDYLKNPVYGLGQLPKFIRPFPDGFFYDLKQFKSISENYLKNTLLLNPRKDKWIFDAIQIYLMMEYVEKYYPDMKILGNLSDIFGIDMFHAADLKFNDQYQLLYMFMARKNLDQSLDTHQDLLLNFNKEIASPYKAGIGLNYLDAFLGDSTVIRSIGEFYSSSKFETATPEDFKQILKENAEKDISWFFEDYVGTDEKIDFTIKKAEKQGDSLLVTIKNKTENEMPVSLYGLHDKEVVFKTWVEDIDEVKTVKIPSSGIERLALNYRQVIPEINQRDNYKAVTTFLNKPVQFRLFRDVEDPRFTQIFFMPEFQFNLYDGFTIGPKIYNRSLLERNFNFEIAPMYGFKSRTLVGGLSFSHRIQFEDEDLFEIIYGAGASRFSYGYDLFYEKFTPFLLLSFRDEDLRKNKRQFVTIRNVNVFRDQNLINPFDVPDYNVFNINYAYRNTGMVDYFTGNLDFQLAEQFSKFSVTAEFRKLFKNNRQINLRFFGGAFIYNDVTDSDYFSFALDRPTDYLYDYNYYGRSETSGLFSQQLIMAEGGFKSQIEPEFANQWLMTVNGSTNIWKWVYVYGDIGLVKNQHEKGKFVYDSGIRLSFLADYFELYFPVYSSLGWEISQENYDQRIRFIATLDLNTLIRLFSRDWY